MDNSKNNKNIKVIIGLGNPGAKFENTRHNIGFMVIDSLAEKYNGSWRSKDNFDIAQVGIDGKNIDLIKPQTYMNNSGQVVPYFKKQGISAEQVLVVHDELEKAFGNISIKHGGSARGHNGLKSLISYLGDNFWRLRVGIGRPENKEDVPDYVLSNFTQDQSSVNDVIDKSTNLILEHLNDDKS